jgi:hypothetical protein
MGPWGLSMDGTELDTPHFVHRIHPRLTVRNLAALGSSIKGVVFFHYSCFPPSSAPDPDFNRNLTSSARPNLVMVKVN